MTSITVCIATYRRPQQLALLLADLTAQTTTPTQVVVVDNDPAQSARTIVSALQATPLPFTLEYAVQPQKNISLTRNLSVALATGDWLALVDDDERAPPNWLERLCAAADRYRCDGVLGPVVPLLPPEAPHWLHRGHFYDFPRQRSGMVVPLNRLRLGNALLRTSSVRAEPGPFDPAYGLTGGEDGDLLARLAHRGACIVWSDEACVHEPVDPSRLTLRWLMRRALRGGQDFARHTLNGRYGRPTPWQRAQLVSRASAQLVAAALLALISAPFGRHRAVRWLLSASANFGKLSLFWGWHYREYA